jgi:hypothetical protein
MNVNDPISTLKEKLVEVQRELISGEMSHTDLNNWFFDFCTELGYGIEDVSVNTISFKTEKSTSVKTDIVYYNCNKDGEYEVGALAFTHQVSLGKIKNKLKKGYILIRYEGSYTILPDTNIDKYVNVIKRG